VGELLKRDKILNCEPPTISLAKQHERSFVPYDNRDIPPRYLQYGLDAFESARAMVSRFLDGDTWCLYLHGETDSRKTTLACAIITEWRKRERHETQHGHFLPVYDVVRRIRAVSDPQSEEYLKAWRASPFMVIDDLCKHRDTPHVIEQLLFMLHYRYDWAKKHKTIITANVDLGELAKRIDSATARRIEEGIVMRVTVPGKQKEAPTGER